MFSGFATLRMSAILALFLAGGCDHASVQPKDGEEINRDDAIAIVDPAKEKAGSRDEMKPALVVDLLPEEPRAGEDLRTVVRGSGGPHSYVWTKNGERIVGENKVRLPRIHAVHGDVIKVVVAARDSKASAETVIRNSPPRVTTVTVESSVLWRGDDFEVKPQAVDADGDPVNFRYVWKINDEELISETDAILPGTVFRRGDVVRLAVVPFDAEEEGAAFEKGLEFRVENAPPRFVSFPPKLVTSRTYHYLVQAVDPDNDKLDYALITGPAGMEIDPETGLLHWLIPIDTSGTIAVRIEARDPEGKGAFQEYVLEIDPGR